MSDKFPPFIFIDREDCEWLMKVPKLEQRVVAEYSPESHFITKTETYFHRDKIVQMQSQISQLEERLRIATDFIESRRCKTYVGIAPPGKEVSVHSHDCLKCKTLAAIKEKNEKT